jgi:hypothetical protein
MHNNRLSSFDKDLRLDCLRMEGPYHDPGLAIEGVRMGPKNAVWVRMLDADKPFYVF